MLVALVVVMNMAILAMDLKLMLHDELSFNGKSRNMSK
jgi:hypothetical protein